MCPSNREKQKETRINPELEALRERVAEINDQIQAAIGLNLTDDSIPDIELFSETKVPFLQRVLNRARGYSKGAGADKSTRTIVLQPDATDEEIAHELTHFIHWDLLADKNASEGEESQSEDEALLRQAWEEGVAVFGEMEYLANKLTRENGQTPSDLKIMQMLLSSFRDLYKTNESYEKARESYFKLIEATKRFSSAEKSPKRVSSKGKPSIRQLTSDVKTIATSKMVIYDIGYRFVIDATGLLMMLGNMNRINAFELVMSHCPRNIEELTHAQIFVTRLLLANYIGSDNSYR